MGIFQTMRHEDEKPGSISPNIAFDFFTEAYCRNAWPNQLLFDLHQEVRQFEEAG
jgi:hypothetical protein